MFALITLQVLLTQPLSSSHGITVGMYTATVSGDEPVCPYNCSLAGGCVNGSCKCDAGFTGSSCGSLDLASNQSAKALYQHNRSSWGGAVLGIKGKFYMYAAVMANGCGLDTWECNSQCSVAVSDTVAGPYAIDEEHGLVAGSFCHNPTAHLTPDGTIVIFHIGNGLPHDGVPPMHCQSGNGSTDPSFPHAAICKKQQPRVVVAESGRRDDDGNDNNNGNSNNYNNGNGKCFAAGQFKAGDTVEPGNAMPNIAWANASTPLGPFQPLRDPKASSSWDANNAAVHIYSNGTVLVVAKFSCNSTISPDPKVFCRQLGLFTAPRWDAPSFTFIKMLELYGEDPGLFQTARGLHMIADLRQYLPGLPGPLPRGPIHAFSSDGLDWTINMLEAGVLENGGLPVTRRERPHILMHTPHEDEERVPLALFNGASLGNTHSIGGDQTFTLVQPFR